MTTATFKQEMVRLFFTNANVNTVTIYRQSECELENETGQLF